MKVWIDVTGLYHWSGNFTGIQRIVFNIAQNLELSDVESGLFIYRAGRYSEVNFAAIEVRLKELNKYSSSAAKQNTTSLLKPSTLIYHSLVTMKKVARNTALETPLKKFYTSIRKQYRQLRKLSYRLHHKQLFNKNDVVIVIDGNWHIPGFVDTITEDKRSQGFRLIHFVNDLVAFKNPAFVNTGAEKVISKYFKRIFSVADDLVAISNSTKRDIEDFIKVKGISNKPKLHVIRLGDDSLGLNQFLESKRPKNGTSEPFILAVGTLEIRKNYRLLYSAYKLAEQSKIALPNLIIVGKKGWMIGETQSLLTEDPDIKDKITLMQKVSDNELKWLYDNCQFTVFPSMYEGWGLPIAESLMHGKCCIASNVSSMPEVGGELAVYASPYDSRAWLNAIKDLSSIDIRSKMEARINREYVSQSWAKSTEQLVEIIKD